MAWLGKTGDKRVASATFFTAQLDFEDAGELQIFVDEHILEVVGEDMEKGYMPADRMANAFNMLRANDLIWGYMVSNYMLGQGPVPVRPALLERGFDGDAGAGAPLLPRASSTSGTPSPRASSRCAASRSRSPTSAGRSITWRPRRITSRPAASVYRGAKEMTRAEVRFVLSGSGHIAGVVNPPVLRQVPVLDQPRHVAADARGLARRAPRRPPGSWWPDWDAWLKARSGRQVPAREPGARLGVIEPAPGSYVKVRFDAAGRRPGRGAGAAK